MKRSINLVDNSTTPSYFSVSNKRRPTEKVANSLSNVSFPWPDHDKFATTDLLHKDEETDYSSVSYVGEDTFTAYGGSVCENDSDHDDDMIELLTELSQEHNSFDNLDYVDSVEDFIGEVFQPQFIMQGPEESQVDAINSKNVVMPHTTIDQAFLDSFMAEYVKFVNSSTGKYMTFPDFVAVSLDMIASFTKATAAAGSSTVTSTNCVQTQQSRCENGSTFDFSIQNWQRRAGASNNHYSSQQHQEQQEALRQEKDEERRGEFILPTSQMGFLDDDEFQFQIFDDEDTKQFAGCYYSGTTI